jgi:hypothetical protein
MKKTKGIHKGKSPFIIKAVVWRQSALTLFLLLCAVVFAFIDYVGPVVSWVCTILFGILFVLSLLDQLVQWSRLRIDENGYDLSTWFKTTTGTGMKKSNHLRARPTSNREACYFKTSSAGAREI